MSSFFNLEIVSAERQIFSGCVKKMYLRATNGGIEILANHAPILTFLEPGPVWVELQSGKEEGFVVLGGFLEVQSNNCTVLADSALRAEDIDESQAIKRKEKIERRIRVSSSVDYKKAHSELAYAAAQLQLIKKLRSSAKF